MEKKLVPLLVLLLELTGVFALYIVQSEVDNKPDVYEVRENGTTKSLTFINPKSERPTLREIIYLHVIETPYGQEKVINEHLNDSEEFKHGNDSAIDNEPPIDNPNAINKENLTDNANLISNEDITSNENVTVNESIIDNAIAINNEATVNNEKVIANELIIGNADISTENALTEEQGGGIDYDDGPRAFTNGQGFQYFNDDPETQKLPADTVNTIYEDSEPEVDPAILDANKDNSIDEEHAADPQIPITDLKPADNVSVSNENSTNLDKEHPHETINATVNDATVNGTGINDDQIIDSIDDDEKPDPDNPSNVKEHDDKDTSESKRPKRETKYSDTANEEHPTSINIEKLEDQITELGDKIEDIAMGEERGVKKQPKTYGMKLTGDIGVVWNNINDLEVSHAVGATNNEIENRKDKREKRAGGAVEELSKNVKTEHEFEEPAINDGTIEKPGPSLKTYGMSLNGDRGTVWNDLNGVLYQVGEPNQESDEVEKDTEVSPEDDAAETSTKPNLHDILDDILKPSDEIEEDKDLPSEIDDAFTEIGDILNEITKVTDDPKHNTNNKTVNEIIDIIKEVFKNETAKFEEKLSNYNNSKGNNDDKNENLNDGDEKTGDDELTTEATIVTENPIDTDGAKYEDNNDNQDDEDLDEALKLPDIIKTLMDNEPFWTWISNWTSTYIELLMAHLDDHIKAEVAKQIKEYNATHAHDKLETNCNERDNNTSGDIPEENIDNTKNIDDSDPNNEADNEIKGDTDEAEEGLSSKKRKDKDCEDKNEKKEDPVNVQANNVYGNSVGNGKVTNIFIYNIGKKSDLDKIRPLHNGTNGIYVFGNDNKIPDDDSDKLEGNKDPAKDETSNASSIDSPDNTEIEDSAAEKLTAKPDNSSEKPVEGVKPDEVTENPKETIEESTKLSDSAESKDNDAAEVDDEDIKPNSNELSNGVSEDTEIENTTAENKTLEPDVEEKPNITTESLEKPEESATSAPENEDSKDNNETKKEDSDGTKSDNDESKENKTLEPDAEDKSNITEGLKEPEESATSTPENEDSEDSDATKSDNDESKEDIPSNSKQKEETTQSPDTEVNNNIANKDAKKEKLRVAKHKLIKKKLRRNSEIK